MAGRGGQVALDICCDQDSATTQEQVAAARWPSSPASKVLDLEGLCYTVRASVSPWTPIWDPQPGRRDMEQQ